MSTSRLIAAATAALALVAMSTSPSAAMTPSDPLPVPDAGHSGIVTQSFENFIGNDTNLGARDIATIDLLTAAAVLYNVTDLDAGNSDLLLGTTMDLGGADGHFGHIAIA